MNVIQIVRREGMEVTGLVLHTSFLNQQHAQDVPPFFHRVLAEGRLEALPHRVNRNQLCVFLREQNSLEFDYLMGVEVAPGSPAPAGMQQVVLPAGEYAMVSIVKRGPQDVGAAFAAIYEQWLPLSGYRPTGAPGFVYYDDRFFSIFNRVGYAGNPVADVYVPICPK